VGVGRKLEQATPLQPADCTALVIKHEGFQPSGKRKRNNRKFEKAF
jgi:hypothetical protein